MRSLANLVFLQNELKKASLEEKKHILEQENSVQEVFSTKPCFKEKYLKMPLDRQVLLLSLLAIDVFEDKDFLLSLEEKKLQEVLEELVPLDLFFKDEGGLIGYQKEVHLLLLPKLPSSEVVYHTYNGIDITKASHLVHEAILWGIKALPSFAVMYAVGGAADRLGLFDPTTKEHLPAVCLLFDGKTLLERLIDDLQAKEYLYFKLFDEQVITPIVLMTSQEKCNHAQIEAICKKSHWFGRGKDNFYLFDQPLVPMVDRTGYWQLNENKNIFLKPGGHGVIWKLACDKGIFELLMKKKRTKLLLRQINNPIAGLDYGLLALMGIGFAENKKFGFASCERLTKSAEGMNVLIEKKKGKETTYLVSNVEYCDFERCGIEDEPKEKGSVYSKFGSNTNILFADIQAIKAALKHNPLPGKILNFKAMQIGSQTKDLARLETTMQNIADAFEEKSLPIQDVFLTFNHRDKTIAACKKRLSGKSFLETPESSFYILMKNAYELLTEHLHFKVHPLEDIESFLKHPTFLFSYLPALGPLYSILAQKIRTGSLEKGAELILDIAEVEIKDLSVEGSLIIQSDQALGVKDEKGILRFGDRVGRCTLKRVRVSNAGLDKGSLFWTGLRSRKGSCIITLKGFSEFYAEDVTLEDNLHIIIEEGTKVVASQEKGKVKFSTYPIEQPSWKWQYISTKNNQILLKKETPALKASVI